MTRKCISKAHGFRMVVGLGPPSCVPKCFMAWIWIRGDTSSQVLLQHWSTCKRSWAKRQKRPWPDTLDFWTFKIFQEGVSIVFSILCGFWKSKLCVLLSVSFAFKVNMVSYFFLATYLYDLGAKQMTQLLENNTSKLSIKMASKQFQTTWWVLKRNKNPTNFLKLWRLMLNYWNFRANKRLDKMSKSGARI